MNSLIRFSFLTFFIASAFFVLTSSQDVVDVGYLTEGVNNIRLPKNISGFDGIDVKELIRYNPSIDSVSYYDVNELKTVGFVNILGGVGKNFLLIPGGSYEVYSKKNVSLVVPLIDDYDRVGGVYQ